MHAPRRQPGPKRRASLGRRMTKSLAKSHPKSFAKSFAKSAECLRPDMEKSVTVSYVRGRSMVSPIMPQTTDGTDYGDRRQNQNGTRGSGLSEASSASARAYRCAEYRFDESGRVLPQLLVQLVQGRSRREGRCDEQGREPRGHLRHALRDLEGRFPGKGNSRAAGRDEESASGPLISRDPVGALWMRPPAALTRGVPILRVFAQEQGCGA